MHNLYVLYGEEKFLIEQDKDKIIKGILNDDIDNTVSKYNMNQTSIDEVLQDATMISLFTDKKVIVCNDCSFLTASTQDSDINHNLDNLIKYINSPISDTIIIFMVNNKLDERKKIVKELRKKAIVKEFNKLKENDLYIFAKDLFKKNNYEIDNKALRLLVDRVQNNLEFLSHEIDKLMIYKLEEKIITEHDVQELTTKPIVDNIFELTEAVIKKDINRVFNLYQSLTLMNEEPIKIIVILANQFRLIYQVKRMRKLGFNENDIVSQLGVHPYRIKLAGEVKLGEKNLLTYIERLADLDIGIKTGKINKDIGLELFFLQL